MQTNDSPPVMDDPSDSPRHHNSQELFLHELPAPEMSPAEIYSQPGDGGLAGYYRALLAIGDAGMAGYYRALNLEEMLHWIYPLP